LGKWEKRTAKVGYRLELGEEDKLKSEKRGMLAKPTAKKKKKKLTKGGAESCPK